MNRIEILHFLFIFVISVYSVHSQKDGESPSVCVDRSAVCGDWVTYCDKIPDGTFQKHWCPKTCKRCGEKIAVVLSDAAPNLPAPEANGNSELKDLTSTSISASSDSTTSASTALSSALSSDASSSSTLASTESSSAAVSTESSSSSSGSTSAASVSSDSLSSSTESGVSSTTASGSVSDTTVSSSTISSGAPSSISSETSSSSSGSTLSAGISSSASTDASVSSSSVAPVEASNVTVPTSANDTAAHPGLKSIFDENPSSKLISDSNSSSVQGSPEWERPYLCQPDWRLLPKLNDDNVEMALKLYRKAVADSPKDNVVFSPTSIALALSLMEVGVKASALEEIRQGISKSLKLEETADAFAALSVSLKGENGQNKDYRLNFLNALYIDNQFPVQQSFQDNIQKCYQAKIGNFSFQRESDKSRVAINDEIIEKSEYKMKNLFPPSSIDSDDRLILVNTAHMFGQFLHPFSENGRTYNRLFYPPNNAPGQEVTMMNTEGYFRYHENSDLQVLGIDYKQHELSLFIFLPHNREGLSQFERQLEPQQLQKLMNDAKDERVEVTLPKFAINYRLQLKDSLKALGIKQLFDISVDMSPISKKKDLFLTNAVHQSFFKAAEEGTESGAPKATQADSNHSPTKAQFVFHAEHSFVFAVRHDLTKSLVFFGRVVNGNIKD